jgi:PKD repeat protein
MGGRGVIRSCARRAVRGLVLACGLVCLSGSVLTGVASATETTVNFDGLSSGTIVKTQYEAQGLKLGSASELGRPSPGEGDCGAPTVQAEGVFSASSPPNYATLPGCPAANPFKGTFGALAGTPRRALSVEVRNLTVGSAEVEVQLIGYDGEGHEVASAHVEAVTGEWRQVTLLLSGKGEISYFMIRTAKASAPSIGIDNLTFEQASGSGGGSGGGGTTTTTTTTPPPSPPGASLALQTPNPGPGEELTVTGAASQPGSGHIISYDWDLNGDGKSDTSTGTNPIVHLILAPGPHTIGLTVTSSSGQSSTSKIGLTMPSVTVSIPPPDGGQGPCEPTLEVGFAQLIAECIQKTTDGYVIETRQLAVNGMVLKPQGGGYGVFKIQTVKDLGIAGTQTLLTGSPVNVELLNTPIGDVVLGGRDLESEPIQLTIHSGLGGLKVPLNHSLRAHRASEATAKTLLMAIGVGHQCTSSESKKAGCCPPSHENTACATLPGNFPLVGQVDVYLTNKGQALFDVQVGLELKGIFEATGALEIEADPQTGVNLNSLKFTIPEAGLEGIFTVKKALFAYYFPSAPEESKRDTWQAEGEITFGPLGEPSLEAQLAFKKGQFHSASLVFQAPPPGVPIYPGVFLNKLGGSVGVEPFAFGGVLGAKVATQLELTLSFKYREASGEELGFFGGQGQLELGEDKIATLAADVYSDGYIDAQLSIDLHLPFSSESPVVKVGGNIGFWDETKSGLWQAEGNVYLKLWEISAEVGGLVNNEYIAGCAAIAGFGAQGRYKFSDGSIGGGLFGFSNCSDQLKQYQEQPLVKHSGGFVGGESLRGPLAAAAAQTEGDTFTLPKGQFAQELRFTSGAGTPVITLISPGGQTYTTPLAPGHIVTSGSQFIAAVAPDHAQVLVLLKHPQAGTWRVQSAAGSPPLSTLEVAKDTPPAKVRVRVRHGHGGVWSLTYAVANHVAGTSVRFVERGRDSTHVLATVSGAAGKFSFVPQVALGRSRKIVAYLLNSEGAPVRGLSVGRYSAPGALRPGRPGRVLIVRHGLTATVRWGGAANARSYAVRIKGSDGRLQTLTVGARHRSVMLANVLPFENFTVLVIAKGGPELLPGRSRAGSLAALKPPKASPHKRRARKRGK